MRRTVYVVTEHGYGEAFETPRRHPLNPPHSGTNWQIVKSDFGERRTRLIWQCEVEVLPPSVKPPSKFHPHFVPGKKKPAKKAKPKAAPAPAPAPAPKPEPKKPARPRPAPKAAKPNGAPEVPAAGK